MTNGVLCSIMGAEFRVQVHDIPSWLYSLLPGRVRSLTARGAKPESDDEAAQMECSD